MKNLGLIALGTLFMVIGGIAFIWGENYRKIEQISGGYREYTVKPEVIAVSAGMAIFGTVLLVVGLWLENKEEDQDLRRIEAMDVSSPPKGQRQFCAYCGARIEPTPFCPYCGSKNG
jgi:hypothetical protein